MSVFKLNELKSNETIEKTGDTTTAPLEEDTNKDDKESESNNYITLDGPLSSIYTKALNDTYSLEGIDAGGMVKTTPDDTSRYVYATDADKMTIDTSKEIIASLKVSLGEDYDDRTIIMDNVKNVAPPLQLVDNYCEDNGINVVFNANGNIH